jgi:hypothetical protein
MRLIALVFSFASAVTLTAFAPSGILLLHRSPVGTNGRNNVKQSFVSSRTVLAAKKAKKKKKASSSGTTSGGFGAKAPTKVDELAKRAMNAKAKEVRNNPSNARIWLELGSVAVKMGDYAEAEEVFRLGNLASPGDQMLSGAHVALAGHSSHYFGGMPSTKSVENENEYNPNEFEFDTYEVNQKAEDFRTVSWTARNDRPRVQVTSSSPLLPKQECVRAIEMAEEHAANTPGGWTSSRHTQAATTDIPVKDIPPLLNWFNDKLESTLFPMLASRFPEKISSASDLRAHDAFIVKYDGDSEGSQNSLAVHTDESAFSFTIALNDRSEYEGGGTCFENIRLEGSKDDYAPLVLNADAGGVVAFPGTIRHGGAPVTKGIRYIIPLFLYLHENKSGKEKGYVTNELVECVEKAQKRQRISHSM